MSSRSTSSKRGTKAAIAKMTGNFRLSARLTSRKALTQSYCLYFSELKELKRIWNMLRTAIANIEVVERSRNVNGKFSHELTAGESMSGRTYVTSSLSVEASTGGNEVDLSRRRSASHSVSFSNYAEKSESYESIAKSHDSDTGSHYETRIASKQQSIRKSMRNRPPAPPPPTENAEAVNDSSVIRNIEVSNVCEDKDKEQLKDITTESRLLVDKWFGE